MDRGITSLSEINTTDPHIHNKLCTVLGSGPFAFTRSIVKKKELTPIIAELQANYSGTQQGLNDGKYRTRSEQHHDSFIYKRLINGATKWLIYPHECYSSTKPGDLSYIRCAPR
jgi:hypothetical protein